jgi:23S rRNA pseudouridine1911/1915/1917 synthase
MTASPPMQLVLPPEDRAKRLDRCLADHLRDFSRARLQTLIAEGQVRVDGTLETNAARKMRGGETVTVTLPEPEPAGPQPEILPLKILHEDADLIVVNKAAGMVVHPSNGHERGTLVHALLAHCGDSLSGINGILRPGIVHRLDKDTSGILVVAKHDRAHRHLAAQFADHGRTGALERRYQALVWGRLPRQSGTIEAGIARSTANRERMVVSNSERARFAITHYAVSESYPPGEGALASLIRCTLETGRTHQIRVHLAHIGHPLLGDSLYGSGFRTRIARLPEEAQAALAALDRQALHAEWLAFEHPRTREVMTFETAPPADFERLRAALAKL